MEELGRLISIIMISFTICALGGIVWLQKEIGENKHDYTNYLMMRYQEPFDVDVKYDWEQGKFIGKFSKNGTKPFYHVEGYQDGTFYDNLLEQKWKKKYEDNLQKDLAKLGATKKKVDITIVKGTDAFLFGNKVAFEGDIPLEDAIEKGLEKRMKIHLISSQYDSSKNEELNAFYKELSKRTESLTIDYPEK